MILSSFKLVFFILLSTGFLFSLNLHAKEKCIDEEPWEKPGVNVAFDLDNLFKTWTNRSDQDKIDCAKMLFDIDKNEENRGDLYISKIIKILDNNPTNEAKIDALMNFQTKINQSSCVNFEFKNIIAIKLIEPIINCLRPPSSTPQLLELELPGESGGESFISN